MLNQQTLNREENVQVICFGDNNHLLHGTKVNGLEVRDISTIRNMYIEDELDSVVIATSDKHIATIAKQLAEEGIDQIFMIPPYFYRKRKDTLSLENILFKIDTNKPRMKYFEYHVVDHCNLNCKGCGHLCNLVKEPVFGDLEQFKKDLHRLKELVWGIECIRLMGGEPLLNPQLDRFAAEARKVFPDASIRIVTNGLLIDKMDENLYEVMRENDIIFDISRYKPTEKKLSVIQAICNIEGIRYSISDESIDKFFKKLDITGRNDAEKSYASCVSKTCAFLRDGKLSVCCAPMLIHRFNEEFGCDIHIDKDDMLDIYEITDGWEMVEWLKRPISSCRYCSPNPQFFDWEIGGYNVKLNDWLID